MTDAIYGQDAVASVEQDAYRLRETGLGLYHDLTADATGRYRVGCQFTLWVASCDGYSFDRNVRILCAGSKDGGAFSTDAGRESSILLVAAYHHLAILKE